MTTTPPKAAEKDSVVRPAHTPGPFHRNIPPASKYNAIFAGRNKHVCHLYVIGLSDEEIEGNANLFAAAPDLLSALKACHLQMLQSNNDSEYAQEANDQAIAAIAKAEGQAK